MDWEMHNLEDCSPRVAEEIKRTIIAPQRPLVLSLEAKVHALGTPSCGVAAERCGNSIQPVSADAQVTLRPRLGAVTNIENSP